jgi:SPP1 gp7 family putative phage head morphogenesis protein
MPKKILQPIIYKDTWHAELAGYLSMILYQSVFYPLLVDVNKERIDNAKDTLLERYLKDGKIQYKDGKLSGQISASISKEIKGLGGKFERGNWHLPEHKMPFVLKRAVDYNVKSMKALSESLTKKLDTMVGKTSSFVKNMSIQSMGVKNMDRVSTEFKKIIRKNLGVAPQLSVEGLEQISKDYLTTIELPIRRKLSHEFEDQTKIVMEDFEQEVVEKLRADISEMILAGSSRVDLRNAIQKRLGISHQRCKFIARQETALLVTTFKKSQYQQYGIDKYKWKTVGDHKVRQSHAELNNDEIDWDRPPIVDPKTGRTAHAGMDFNCFVGDTPISTIGIPIRSYNRHYVGKIITLDTGTIRIKTTPNHPILTLRGWVPAQFINDSDQVFERLSPDKANIPTQDINNRSVFIKEVHDFFAISFPSVRVDGSNIQFHGDGTNEEVNIVSMDSSLMTKTDVIFPKNISENILSFSDSPSSFFQRLSSSNGLFDWHFPANGSSMTGFNLIAPSDSIHPIPFKFFSGTLISDGDMILFENSSNGSSCAIKLFSDDILAITRFVHLDDILGRQIFFVPRIFMPFTLATFRTITHEEYSGNVYNLETESNLYLAGDTIVSNCRCQAIPIVEW